MKWMPIETAPKDGTLIMVYKYVKPWRVMGTAYWCVVGTFGNTEISGWISRGITDPPGNLGLGEPTHWMPLPEPPKPEG